MAMLYSSTPLDMVIHEDVGPETTTTMLLLLPPPAQADPYGSVGDMTATAAWPAFGGGLGGDVDGGRPVQRASKPCNHSRTSCRCANWVANGVDLCGACYSGQCNA